MPIELKMPALSPTMEEGTLAKWLVKEGDAVSSGDILAEIETDKATMEFEAIDEGTIAKILVAEGADAVKVGTVIAIIEEEDEDEQPSPPARGEGKSERSDDRARGSEETSPSASPSPVADAPPAGEEGSEERRAEDRRKGDRREEETAVPAPRRDGERILASPLARRIAEQRGLDLTSIKGSGPGGRIVKADVESAAPGKPAPAAAPAGKPADAPAPAAPADFDIPHTSEKLSNMRKTIARRLTESKQTVPHIYLTVDIRLDALLKLRGELNASLELRGIKLSVNDLLIKALAVSLMQVPKCNVQFAGDQLLSFSRADISVAVSIPNGLITPIVVGADTKALSAIATEMKDLAGRAKQGKLQPHEYQGGTASLSNMGMFGISSFSAVINPPQGMIMAIGAGEKRPWVIDDSLQIATIMSATGSFDHRAIDGADGAEMMKVFKALVESPLGMLA